MAIYPRENVGHLWIVDPQARTLEIYRLDEGRWIVVANHGGGDRVHAEPFARVEIALEQWWLESTAE
jgi:hypothetical protein